jgi:imidazolonepropionase-like amidohydrolase
MTTSRLRATIVAAALVVEGVALAQPAQPPKPGPVKAFGGFRLIDGTGEVLDNAAMLVQDGRITAIGPLAKIQVPTDAVRVPLFQKTVMPGLINSHGHVNDAARDLRVYAAYGVTTVLSLGGESPAVFAARDSQATSALSRSRVFLAGPVLSPASPEEARTQVAELAGQKVDFVKIRVDDNLGTSAKMPPEVYRAVIDEAHARGMRVAAHLFYLEDARDLVDAGVDFIAHSVRDGYVDADLIARLRRSGICFTPTLMREVSTFVYEDTPAFFSDPLFTAYSDRAMAATLREPARQEAVRASASAQRYKVALQIAANNLKILSDAGIPVAMGTDTGPAGRFQGYFELLELELMVKAGLTPQQALAAATREAARCLRLDADLGTLQTGKWADFVVLNDNPLDDIANAKKIDSVWIAGNRVAR